MSSQGFQKSVSPLKSFAEAIKPWVKITRATLLVGPMMLFWPYAWSLTIAARVHHLELPEFMSFLVHGFLGSQLLHRSGAGCIWDDICDREFDRQVERTKNRPIAAGTITVPGALVFLFIHLVILMRMIWNLDEIAFRFGVLSIVVLPGIYPLMKRVTYWPQAWLGLSLNVGAPMAWLALGQSVPTSIVVLFAGTWAWTMWYDTIYACQDKRDDVVAGVKSTALLFGTWIRPILFALASALVASLYVAGVMNNLGKAYHAISVVGGGFYLAKEMYTVDLDSPKACWDSFLRNGFVFGGLVWAGVLSEYLTSL
ncbi:4-hydroxybenzoate polyprenyl transferase [Lyophyllum atratum]|nr:4-hydroxybenzoate polyprenyl transferase [Lyophyllum atratum]